MDDKELTILDLQTLDLMEAGAEADPALIDELEQNDELRRQCREIEAMTTALRMQREKVDVEAQLASFHRRHTGKARLRTAAIIIGIAALFAGAVMILRHEPATKSANPALVYTPGASHGSVVLSREGNGKEVIAVTGQDQLLSFRTASGRVTLDKVEVVTLEVQEGKSFSVELPDGSRVWLHPGSTIVFPERFIGNLREVKLSGEAYFQVRHDPSHPFTVRAGKMETTVLGTEFDVTSYSDRPATVTLVSGSVAVKAAGRQCRIRPGTQVTLNADEQMEIKTVSTEKYTNWRDGYFYFDNTSLREVLTEIGRNYGVSVECSDTALLGQRMHFVAERHQSLSAILSRLREITPMQTSLQGNVLTVR